MQTKRDKYAEAVALLYEAEDLELKAEGKRWEARKLLRQHKEEQAKS